MSDTRPPFVSGRRVQAVLGPTNTGKTFLAVERMLGHRSGMIGFPLRLLARENYDRIVAARGTSTVALVTGEEKIVPPNPRYWVCTVESMPLDREVAFMAIDEIQMAADPERGHIFTERLLTARGIEETMFLGSETARGLIRRLVPEVEFVTRPRFSNLSYAGHKKVTRLPPRTAVVAFAASEVYRLAELVRRQRGGTAVVLGALSPRARNAQVGMYQAGEVDYLVATDAIGMGLNMDVRHVAFASLIKFDGRRPRDLVPAEIGQIAGRAGRHVADGTFGTTAEQGPMEGDLVQRVETHEFDPLRRLYWRNYDLDFASVERLQASLDAQPPWPCLVRAREADDQRALQALAREPSVLERARSRQAVALLWEVCQIPDFRKTLTDSHTRLLARAFAYLSAGRGVLPTDWVAKHVQALDRTDGDFDTLMARIAATRTWTYISHRTGWLDDPSHWQDRTRAIEDRLSDALHERLTQRFVDRRTAVLVRRLRDGDELLGAVTHSGEVVVEGERVGQMEGFRFRPDRVDRGEDSRPLMNAAHRVLRSEIDRRVDQLAAADDGELSLDDEARIHWGGAPIAALLAGDDVLGPRAEPLGSDLLDGRHRRAVRGRVQAWLDAHVERLLRPLIELKKMDDRSPAARGIGFHISEMLGVLPRRDVRAHLPDLKRADRRRLSGIGVFIGRQTLYVPRLLKGRAHRLRLMLWQIFTGESEAPPPPGRNVVSFQFEPDAPDGWHRVCGFEVIGRRAVRVDRLERLSERAWQLASQGGVKPSPDLARLIRCDVEDLVLILERLGFKRSGKDGGGEVVLLPRRDGRSGKGRQRHRSDAAPDPATPFARLAELRGRA